MPLQQPTPDPPPPHAWRVQKSPPQKHRAARARPRLHRAQARRSSARTRPRPVRRSTPTRLRATAPPRCRRVRGPFRGRGWPLRPVRCLGVHGRRPPRPPQERAPRHHNRRPLRRGSGRRRVLRPRRPRHRPIGPDGRGLHTTPRPTCAAATAAPWALRVRRGLPAPSADRTSHRTDRRRSCATPRRRWKWRRPARVGPIWRRAPAHAQPPRRPRSCAQPPAARRPHPSRPRRPGLARRPPETARLRA
jgi:hypothetical protein